MGCVFFVSFVNCLRSWKTAQIRRGSPGGVVTSPVHWEGTQRLTGGKGWKTVCMTGDSSLSWYSTLFVNLWAFKIEVLAPILCIIIIRILQGISKLAIRICPGRSLFYSWSSRFSLELLHFHSDIFTSYVLIPSIHLRKKDWFNQGCTIYSRTLGCGV